MKQCKQCGATLPDHAKYCLECGTLQDEPAPQESPQPEEQPPPPATPLPPLEFIQPALAGGMFLGILSALPIVDAGNFLCCMWVLAGGGLAAILLMRQRPASGIKYGDGAFVGVLSGVFGAVVSTAVRVPVNIIASRFLPDQQQQLEEYLRQFGVEGRAKDLMLQVASGQVSVATVLFLFLSYLLLWSLFAMIGGILTVAVINKRKQKL